MRHLGEQVQPGRGVAPAYGRHRVANALLQKQDVIKQAIHTSQ